MNIESMLPILGELLAKSFAILLVAVLAVRVWRGATAAQRHLVCFAAIVTILLLPMTRLVTPRWAVPLAHATKVRLPLTALPSVSIGEANGPVALAAPASRPRVWTLPDWRSVLAGIWLTGTVLLLGYRLLGSWRLHRLQRRSVAVDDPRVRLLFSRTLSELGMHRRPEIRLSDECRVPVTWGTLRPVLLLPRQALQWNDEWLAAALRHEAAHIRRHDYLTRWIAQIACAIYWPNPFIWLAARALRVAQEQAADDLVLRAGSPADQYAAQLVAAARTVATQGFLVHQAVAMACPSTLEDRVRAIVDDCRERRPLSRLAVAVGSGLSLLTLALCTVAQLQGADENPPAKAETAATRFPKTEIEIEGKFVEVVAGGARETMPIPAQPTVYSDPQFQVIMRALNQKPGVDILSSPRVTTHATQRAVIEIITEFRYPTEWEKEGSAWKPSKSEVKNVGTTMDVEPRIKENGAVELHTVTSVVAFLGFVDLENGQALPAAKNALAGGEHHPPIVSPGHRFRSVFSERRQEFTVEVKSGETVGIPELPETADVRPFAGNAPQGKLTLFVSARILGAAATPAPREPAPAVEPKAVTVRPEALRELRAQRSDRAISASRMRAILGEADSPKGTEGAAGGPTGAGPAVQARGDTPVSKSGALKKAEEIILPKVEFREATVAEAVDFVRHAAVAADPQKLGVELVLKPGPDTADTRMTLDLTTVPLIEAVRYVAGLANLQLHIEPNALQIGPDPAPAASGGPPPPIPGLAPLSDAASLEGNRPKQEPPAGDGSKVRVTGVTLSAKESEALKKAEQIVIPRLEAREAFLSETLELLRKKSVEFDPEKKGVEIVLKPGTKSDARITISLTNIPLIEALKYTASLAGLKVRAEVEAIVLEP